MACHGTVAWMLQGRRHQHETVVPPVQLAAADAPQLAASVYHTV